ncbi:MAG: diphosphate--fructose-6-phosphate 1-phosphotransferase [Hyphomicrobiales bacterium]|nr:diphosphate--fructose-6-phosphate 1-phosphotransferase [Hyphomicrobiales bacterium]
MNKVYVIAQGGGPTAVINQTVTGAVLATREHDPDARFLGARHGVRGVAGGDYVTLSDLSEADLMRFANTPNSGLGSTRDKPDEDYCQRVLAGLDQAGASSFIYIGGNDTSGTMAILDDAAGDEMHFVHAPKTIDNDLVENDHTPGFMSAALFVANAFLSVDLDFRAMPGVYVGIVMGRHAGFLTAAAAAWRRDESDGPHLIYVPEVPFTEGQLVNDIRGVLDRHGRCIIAMSEGVQTADHRPLAETLIPAHLHERDAHGNLQLSGGDLGQALGLAIKDDLPGVRARVDTFGYLPRGFLGTVSEIDGAESFAVGRFAAEASRQGSGSVAQQYENGETALKLVPLGAVANKTKRMPDDFMRPDGCHLTDTGLAYFRRLLPPRPDTWTPFV